MPGQFFAYTDPNSYFAPVTKHLASSPRLECVTAQEAPNQVSYLKKMQLDDSMRGLVVASSYNHTLINHSAGLATISSITSPEGPPPLLFLLFLFLGVRGIVEDGFRLIFLPGCVIAVSANHIAEPANSPLV